MTELPPFDPTESPPEAGWIAAEVREEFPELSLRWVTVEASSGRSPRAVARRLRHMSDRFRGAHAVVMRANPIPWAYRVFYRHIGLDPDADRVPVEAAALERLVKGAFISHNLLDDALVICLMETGVPIWALDAEQVSGRLGIRMAAPGESLGRAPGAARVRGHRLVVADELSPVAVLFGELADGHGVTPATTQMTLFSIQVAGVPSIHVEEGLWACRDILLGQGD